MYYFDQYSVFSFQLYTIYSFNFLVLLEVIWFTLGHTNYPEIPQRKCHCPLTSGGSPVVLKENKSGEPWFEFCWLHGYTLLLSAHLNV